MKFQKKVCGFLKRFKKIVVSLLLVLVLTLTACSRTTPLPNGMDADALLASGREVLLLLVEGEYDAVHELLRADQRAQFTVEDIRTVVTAELDGAGVYEQIDDHMTTGSTINNEPYGIAVFYCDFSEEDVLVRISFDQQMQLVGFALDQE